MSKYRKGVLYIRHLQDGDKVDGFMSAIGLAAKQMMVEKGKRKSIYVMVRHGYPHNVISYGHSKQAVRKNLIFGGHGVVYVNKGKQRLRREEDSFKVKCRGWRARDDKRG